MREIMFVFGVGACAILTYRMFLDYHRAFLDGLSGFSGPLRLSEHSQTSEENRKREKQEGKQPDRVRLVVTSWNGNFDRGPYAKKPRTRLRVVK